MVQGEYEYYHYLQDKVNDNGWGCAYRSLQTICSWFRRQGYSSKPDPSHVEVQQTLVSMGDKPATFIGSSQWIGAFEISLCLDELYQVSAFVAFIFNSHIAQVSCKIINCSSGTEIPSHLGELRHHFLTQGTPVMIGGGVLAYTLLGVEQSSSGKVRFLILDPHYVGKESRKDIQSRGWCDWKEASLFRSDAFYNLCLPQRPAMY